jgi:hypothetical protein
VSAIISGGMRILAGVGRRKSDVIGTPELKILS